MFGTGSGGRTFTIKYTNLTPEACVKLATADWGADESSGLVSIKIGSSSDAHVWASANASATKLLPVDTAEAITECGSTTATGIIEWEFR